MTHSERYAGTDVRYVDHQLQSFEGGVATLSKLHMGDLITDASGTVNPCMPRPARLGKVAIHSACLTDDVAGDWTMHIRKNESGSDTASFTFPLTSTPSKTAKFPTTEVMWQAGDTYHVIADGPQKTIVALRLTIQWEYI